ncbi:MAG: hypothetical protein WEE89_08865 [Gemmatimonadota bacterium]
MSIILGLAVVHLLGGVSLILDARIRAKVYWIHLLWTANMLFLIVLVWLGNFVLAPVTVFSAAHFLNLLAYSMVIYLMSGLLFPVHGEEVADFREHFFANRVTFFSLGVLFVVTDALDGFLEHRATRVALNPGQYATLAVWLVLFVIGHRTSAERFHGVAAIVFFLGLVGFMESLVRYGIVSP